MKIPVKVCCVKKALNMFLTINGCVFCMLGLMVSVYCILLSLRE